LEKELKDFINGNQCKDCIKKYKKEYSLLNKLKIDSNKKEYYENNKSEILGKIKIYGKTNKEKINSNKKIYYKNNKKIILENRKEYCRFKRLNNPLFRLTDNLRSLTYSAFKNKGLRKNTKTEKLLGCSFKFIKEYFESKFEDWMSWDNQGKYNGELNYGWDMDHIIPLSYAKSEEEIIKLCHYTNLQPLCSKINRNIKKDNIIYTL